MEVLKGDDVWEEVIKGYNKKPSSWRALEYESPGGFYDLLIFNPDNTYLLKKDTVYKPLPMVIGIKIDEPEYHKMVFNGEMTTAAQVIRSPTYGFRQMSIKPIMEKIERFVDEGKDPARIFDSFIGMMLKAQELAKRTQPVPTDDLDTIETDAVTEGGKTVRMGTRHALVGPYISVGLEAISRSHRKLSAELDEELRRLLRREYTMYV